MQRRRRHRLALLLSVCLGCGGAQPASEADLIERVCAHAMRVAKRDLEVELTMQQCRAQIEPRRRRLGSGFRSWANCLLNMESVKDAKLMCRESDFMHGS